MADYTKTEPAFDFQKGDFIIINGRPKMTVGRERIKNWVQKILNTQKGRYKIYNGTGYGINIEDTLNDIDEEYVYVSTGNNFTNYRRKVEKFLTGNLENVIVWKIRHNIRLTEQDKENLEKILFEELGNNKEYAETFGDTNIIKAVRNIVGLDKNVVSDIFYKYINDNRLNMKQIQFVKLLIDYVIKNGTIDMQKLTEQPFKNVGEV